MYKDKTEKRRKYYEEVIRLHFEKGYGEDRIAKFCRLDIQQLTDGLLTL